MLAVLCYVCGYGIVCPSILCVRVYLYLLSAGLTYLWLYACFTRITLHNSGMYSKIRHKGPTNTKSIRTSVVVILIITYYRRSMEDIAPLVPGNYWYEYECLCYTSLSLNYCSSQTFNLFISCTIMT